ncbi:hypothetical protein BW723_05720 [Polaribacter reichenbachii]|uniref:Uncharacterized protein n=1 Tax=Polaribacter reichenbachii TaxID=996801 RepID=A0A1B8TYU2_9FLAO|nr:GIDE domain-containing protein [Polaribacter reichenbachii]APZ45824.1 hypothetical protein BW723_05720 [Polaribacter reichenbachii]AUC19686.1 hypothetical protein BTO17_13735 [Polaribacter reichenbachii]OBY64744.1 hypothetical protein LPB301_09990 [Polaribacter reichenbachii]
MDFNQIYTYLSDHKDVAIPILFAVIFITVAFAAYYFSSKQKVKRILSKLPEKRISSLKTNEFSRITGKALHVKEPLIAPFSKRKCVFYVLKIEQEKGGKNKSWETLAKDEKVQEFFIEKNTDFVIVRPTQNPKNYLSHLVVDKNINSGTFNNPTKEFNQLLKKYNIESTGLFNLNKTLKCTEAIIEIGEQITVAGIAKFKSLKEPIEGYNYSKIAELESSKTQKLIITDLPNIKSKKRL